MALKRLPNSLDEAELLTLLNERKEETNIAPKYRNDVLDFISFYKLEPGENKIRKSLIFNLYRKWSKDPIKSTSFSVEMGKYFDYYSNSKGTFYRINTSAIDISVAAYKVTTEDKKVRTKSKAWIKRFEKFMSENNLKPGTCFIEHFVLFFIYDKWIYNNNIKAKLSRDTFHRFCMLYFERKRVGETRLSWFGVDKSFLDGINIDNIRKGYYERQEKANKKRKKQVSSIRPYIKPKN